MKKIRLLLDMSVTEESAGILFALDHVKEQVEVLGISLCFGRVSLESSRRSMGGLLELLGWNTEVALGVERPWRRDYMLPVSDEDVGQAINGLQIDTDRVKTASDSLKNSLNLIQNCQSKDQLRGYEGEAASVYFGVFDELILQQKKDFFFHGRNKRPPLDNVNALLSFVYTLLTNHITSALETVGLDPYVGYLHGDRPGRTSLSLDLVEELRAVLADRFVLSLINRKMISGKHFKKKENGAVLMDDEARKKVLTEWQNRKKEVITHPFLQEKVEWGMVPYVQAALLARYLRGDLDGYPVFLWK